MNVLLIAPSSGNWRHVGRRRFFNGRTFRFSLLTLLSVAAETPEDAEVQIVDEQIDDIPWDADVDLVGITCMTALAPRAYEIADRFRTHGVPVVLGGFHPTFCPDEALQHADAVVSGDAVGIWPDVVEDARCGCLKGVYRAKKVNDLSCLKRPPTHLLRQGNYSTYAVSATRGCPHQCAFCAVSAFNNGTHRCRPVEEIVREVSEIPSKFFIFVDDNLTADRDYAKCLFQALAPLKKWWITQSTLSIADDPEFVRQMAEAGCIGLFVGLETFSESNLAGVEKSFNQVEKYRDAVRLLHKNGITIEAGVVFGFDGDDAGVFQRTLGMLDELKIDLVQISIMTPLPGTPKHRSMNGRIVDRNWEHYDFHHTVFEPKGMTMEELQAGHDWVTWQFYHPWRIVKRFVQCLRRPRGLASLPHVMGINLAYYGRTRSWRIQGWNPAKRSLRDSLSSLWERTSGMLHAPFKKEQKLSSRV